MLIATQYIKGQLNLMDKITKKININDNLTLLRKVLEKRILSFISPKSGMLDVDGLVDYLLERIKEKNETNIS